jgi:Zn-dependent peptidase ImmA (M78 family)
MRLLDELRSVVPTRRLTYAESRILAERQATILLRRSGVDSPAVPTSVITELPFLTVGSRPLLNSSGATKWVKPQWVIVLNSLEPQTRQRFSLGHELKHILDHGRVATLYGAGANERSAAVEHACDYFSACLLMPRTWVKNAYAGGIQDVFDLAELFEVSPQAMQVRLLQLGIVDAYQRHSEIDNTYFRSQPVLLLEPAA